MMPAPTMPLAKLNVVPAMDDDARVAVSESLVSEKEDLGVVAMDLT